MTTTPVGAARFRGVIDTTDELERHYRRPTKLVAEKKLDHVPPWIRVTIEAAGSPSWRRPTPTDGRPGRRRAGATGSRRSSTTGTWRSRTTRQQPQRLAAQHHRQPPRRADLPRPRAQRDDPHRRRRVGHDRPGRAGALLRRGRSPGQVGDRRARDLGLLPLPGVVPAGDAVGERVVAGRRVHGLRRLRAPRPAGGGLARLGPLTHRPVRAFRPDRAGTG